MIRALLLCGVLSVGSAWGQGSPPPCEPDGQGGYKMSIGGSCVIPSAEQYNLVQSRAHVGAIPDIYMRIDPRIPAQLDRIEGLLRALCENTRHSNGLVLPDCPKETKP